MKKRILVLMTLILFLVPLSSAFAYEGGLLHGKPLYMAPNVNTQYVSTNAFTDGDIATYDTIEVSGTNYDTVWYEFSSVVDITDFQYKASGNTYLQFYDINGTLLYSTLTSNRTGIKTSSYQAGVKKVALYNPGNSVALYEFDVFGTDPNSITHDEITNLALSDMSEGVSLTWDIPTTNTDFTGSKIYRDGNLLTTLDNTTNNFTDTTALDGEAYTYKVTATYSDGFESPGVTQTITPEAPPPIPGITELKYEPSYDSASFTWENPTSELFSGVEVYKNGELFTTLASTETTFSDSNLTPETAYTYEFIAAYSDGKTGEAATIGITTDKEPEPVLVSDGYEKDFSGDYLFKWTEPTTGTVKILIDGVEYDTVNAELQQVTIPKEEIKTDNLGNPLVSLVPVSAYGTIGQTTAVKGQNLEIPFSPLDLMNSGNGLLWYVAPFLLLALSFLFVPKVIRLIKESLKKGKSDIQDTRRFKPEEKEAKEQQEREDREKRVKETKERNDKIKAYPELIEKPIKREREKRRLVGAKRERDPRGSFRAIREPRIKARTPKEPRAARRGRE